MAIFKKKTVEIKPVVSAPAVEETKSASAAVSAHRPNYAVLKRPWISEKALLGSSEGKYAFSVATDATKPMVREEVERRYGVHVRNVNIVRFTGKQRYFRGKLSHEMVQKKAVVTLKKGEKIDVQ